MSLPDLKARAADVKALADTIREIVGDDDRAFADTLDGETDAIEAVRRTVRWLNEQAASEEAAKSLADIYGARRRTFAERQERARAALLGFMQAVGTRSLPLPEATLTVSAGRPKVVGDCDPEELPPELVRIKREPDKAAIRDRLERGFPVSGFSLSNSPPTLAVRLS